RRRARRALVESGAGRAEPRPAPRAPSNDREGHRGHRSPTHEYRDRRADGAHERDVQVGSRAARSRGEARAAPLAVRPAYLGGDLEPARPRRIARLCAVARSGSGAPEERYARDPGAGQRQDARPDQRARGRGPGHGHRDRTRGRQREAAPRRAERPPRDLRARPNPQLRRRGVAGDPAGGGVSTGGSRRRRSTTIPTAINAPVITGQLPTTAYGVEPVKPCTTALSTPGSNCGIVDATRPRGSMTAVMPVFVERSR